MRFRLLLVVALFSSRWSATAFPIEPARGLAISTEARSELEGSAARLDADLAALERTLGADLRPLLPDVRVLHRAVASVLAHDEFQHTNDVATARSLLVLGFSRAAELRAGHASWTTSTGLVVRGFVSRVDGSVQPYGVVVPPGWQRGGRLDVWLHGRDERLTELRFLGERTKSRGEFAPADAIVVHPYGRYCNAFKFAGETDVLEALGHAVAAYGTDTNRLAIRGFSMGGGGTWHLAAHHPGLWRAAAPGAGFAETARYSHALETKPGPPDWEQRLWHWYDATDYAANLRQVPLIAYSGERDPQKQAAVMMAEAMATEGMQLEHVIGPGVEHRYEPGAKTELARRFDAIMATPAITPEQLDLTTFTLRYPAGEGRVWARFEGLGTHWERARIKARHVNPARVEIETTNVTAFALLASDFSRGTSGRSEILIDRQRLAVDDPGDGPLHFRRESGRWLTTQRAPSTGKRPGLQGPIDDAFLDSFLVVVPTGKSRLPAVDAWVQKSWRQFTNDWRAQFRGEPRVKRDVDVTPADLAAHHVVVWGDPDSNALLARMRGKLPAKWDRNRIRIGTNNVASADHVPSFIAPNPLNPMRYVVVNSGHTFASWQGTNARQTPWLPDWAVWTLSPDEAPRVESAGFFDERWN